MAKQGKARVLTPAEFKRAEIAASSMRHAKRNVAILHMSFGLALRACEIRRLRICDVLEADGKSLVKEINLLKTMTKYAKQRQVPFTNKKARAAVQEYLEEYLNKPRFTELDLNDPLFPSQKGNFFSVDAFNAIFIEIYKMAGLVGAKSHSGRRTWATVNGKNNTPIRYIQRALGHERLETTAIYMEINPLVLQDIMSKSVI